MNLGGLGVQSVGHQLHEPIFKRPFDLLLSGIGLLLSSPLWLCFAGWIWFEDRGPIFFRQLRIGQNGRLFWVLKFRSMVMNPRTIEMQAGKNDPRITRVGRFMRRTAMDELPQIWNICVGDMSFVGPRAQPEKERIKVGNIEKDIYVRQVPGYDLRQLVRPGLTGITQIYAPREVPHRHKFKYDMIYVRKVLNNARLNSSEINVDQRGIVRTIRLIGLTVMSDIRMLFYDLGLIVQSIWITLRGKWEV